MDLKTQSAHTAPRPQVREQAAPADPFVRSLKVDTDKLAAKLEQRPSAKVSDKLLLVAAKLQKRQRARALLAATQVPPDAAADAEALDPVK